MMRNEEIFAAVRASLEGRTVKNALLIPPDFTRSSGRKCTRPFPMKR